MAYNFLELSQTYLSQFDPHLRRIRQAVCARLKETYKAGRGQDETTFRELTEELSREGVDFSAEIYRDEKLILRGVYMWLKAHTDEDRALALKPARARIQGVVDVLTQDGIQTWADVRRLAGLESSTSADEERDDEVPAPTQRQRLEELGAGDDLIQLLDGLSPALERILEEDRMLKDELARLSEETARLRAEGQDAQTYISLLESDNSLLQDRLNEARELVRRAHGEALAEIAREHPEFPQLSVIAQELSAATSRRKQETQTLVESLPKNFAWASDQGTIRYEERFRRLLLELEPHERDQVIRQLEVLARHGAEYHSLHTRKSAARMLFSPPGCFVSRSADDLRFTWKKNGGITIYWLFRKGDRRVPYHES